MGYLETLDELLPGIGTLGRAENAQQARAAREQEERAATQRTLLAQSAIKEQQGRTLAALTNLGLSDTTGCVPAVVRGHGFVAGGLRVGDLLLSATGSGVSLYAAPEGDGGPALALGIAYTAGQFWELAERLAQVRDGKAQPDAVGLPLALTAPKTCDTPEALAEAAILAHTRNAYLARQERQEREDAAWQRQCDALAGRMADLLNVRLVPTDLTRLTVVDADDDAVSTVIAAYGDLRFALDERGYLGVVRFCPQCEVAITERKPIHGLGDLGAYLVADTLAGRPLGDAPVCARCRDPLALGQTKAAPKPPTVAERLEALVREIAYAEAQSALGNY
jgi:hypothetical protein